MAGMHKLKDFLALEDASKKTGNRFRYVKMAFRPCGTLLICLAIAMIVAVPCSFVMILSKPECVQYDISMAILTGVIASALVSFSIEAANNYRRNRQRIIVLHEYLYTVSMYEQFMQWSMDRLKHIYDDTDEDDFFSDKLTLRQRAIADIELEVVPPIDEALEKGREYLSRKELILMQQIVEASNSIAKITDDVIAENLKSSSYPVYDNLAEPFRTEIIDFSDDVGIRLFDENLRSVVFDYVMSNPEILDELPRSLVKHELRAIDECMMSLRDMVKKEPVYYENLIPLEEKFPELKKLRQHPTEIDLRK